MGKTKMIIKYLLLLLILLFLNMRSYSQELFNKELKWETIDSIKVPVFQNRGQIITWSKNFSSPYSNVIKINDSNICILITDECSGVYCWRISIFKEKDKLWEMVLSSERIYLDEQIGFIVDKEKKVIIFKTESGKIGELPFEKLVDK